MKQGKSRETFYVVYSCEDFCLKKNINLEIDPSGGNKIPLTSFIFNNDNSLVIKLKENLEKIEKNEYKKISSGGNVNNVLKNTKSWMKVIRKKFPNIDFSTYKQIDVGEVRPTFWTSDKAENNRAIALTTSYNKKLVINVIGEHEINKGRVYMEIFMENLSNDVSQIIIPSSSCMEEFKEGMKKKRVFPCVNEGELKFAGFDTENIDWKKESSIIDFISSFLPENEYNYAEPQLLASLEIKEKSVGVYGFKNERFIAITTAGYAVSDEFIATLNIEDLESKSGRGDAQVTGKNLVSNLYKINNNLTQAIKESMRLSSIGSSLLSVIKESNMEGLDEKFISESFEWSQLETRLSVDIIKYPYHVNL